MFEKIWSRHVVAEGPGGHVLLYIDRHLLHEGSTSAFARLAKHGRRVRRPDLTFATADHYVLTSPGSVAIDAEIRAMVESLGQHTREQGIVYFGVGDPRRGIVHIIGPEEGLTLPGITLVCGDSHTATHGAFGALAFGIGSTEVEHVMATQTLWQKTPRVMRITVEGRLAAGVTAKDVILAIIAEISAGGGVGHAIEYAGSTMRAMSMDERMTVCNMSIEAGARAGMVAPDETTFAYLEGRPFAPRGDASGAALAKRAAEAEALDRVFVAAGFEWREAGCWMCVGMNGETAREGERVASTSNRNFEGRQGKGARTHLMSPAMAAAAAVTGRLTDVRRLVS